MGRRQLLVQPKTLCAVAYVLDVTQINEERVEAKYQAQSKGPNRCEMISLVFNGGLLALNGSKSNELVMGTRLNRRDLGDPPDCGQLIGEAFQITNR